MGPRHAETGTTLVRLGDFERRAGRLARAETLLRDGKTILTAALGAENARLVEAWTALGRLYRAEHRATAARDAFLEGERVGKLALGGEHPDVRALTEELATLAEVEETPRNGDRP